MNSSQIVNKPLADIASAEEPPTGRGPRLKKASMPVEINASGVARALRDIAKAHLALADAFDESPAPTEKKKSPVVVDDGEISDTDRQRAKAALKRRGYLVP